MLNKIILLLIFLLTISAGQNSITKVNNSELEGYFVNLNRLNLPIFSTGYIGSTSRNSRYYNAKIDSSNILHSLGFILTGINDEGNTWICSINPKQNINDFQDILLNPNDETQNLFYMSTSVEPFSDLWVQWITAVELGAEFYDGDGDGIYTPVDKNNNGIWDSNEDRPAQYGDVMIWNIYSDNSRLESGINSQQIEVQQTIWSYRDRDLETTFFIKYKITNKNDLISLHDSVYFTQITNPNFTNYYAPYFNTDLKTNSSIFYEHESKYDYSRDHYLSLITHLLQGPPMENWNNTNQGYLLEGENLNFTETNFSNSDLFKTSDLGFATYIHSVDQIRSELIDTSNNINPCYDLNGRVYDDNCIAINSRYLYSGNPLTRSGWINTKSNIETSFNTTGPFTLQKNKPIEIIFSISVGTGEDNFDALRNSQNIITQIYNNFFDDPEPIPKVDPIVITTESSIELVWETPQFMMYSQSGYDYDLLFEGFNVYMYNSNSQSEYVDGKLNKIKIACYDVRNKIDKIYFRDSEENDIDLFYEEGEQLDYSYFDPENGRILLEISRDPFTKSSLLKGRPYYISIVPFALNHSVLTEYDLNGGYLVESLNRYGIYEGESEFLQNRNGEFGIELNENSNEPYFGGVPLLHTKGNSEAVMSYSVYDREQITEDTYEIGFQRLDNPLYSLNYYLKNLTSNDTIAIHNFNDNYNNNIQFLHDGFVINVQWIEPGVKSINFEGEKQWFKYFNNLETGVFYVGMDMTQREQITPILPLKFSSSISIDQIADVDIIFGDSSKAFRYVRNAVRYLWAGSEKIDEGFVNIPVKAIKNNIDGTTTQLNIGFIENASPIDTLKYPDLIWNPGSDIKQSKEYLIVFNSEYSEDIQNNIVYAGTMENIANITHGYNLESENDSLNSIAKSPWFNAMYVIGFEMDEYLIDFSPKGTLHIDANQALSVKDKYTFKVKKENTLDEEKQNFAKINVFPNPLFGYNEASSYYGSSPDDPFVTFTNLPKSADIKIYTLSGVLIKSIFKNDLNTNVKWNLLNDYNKRIASGMYIAKISSEGIGLKVLKLAVIMPQKQVHF